LLWPWCRPAAAALTGPLAWEPPYAMGEALEKAKGQNKVKNKKKDFIPKTCHSLFTRPQKISTGDFVWSTVPFNFALSTSEGSINQANIYLYFLDFFAVALILSLHRKHFHFK